MSLPKGFRHSEKTKRKISLANKGRIPWNKGKRGIYSSEYIQKLSNAHKGLQSGEDSHFWQGGEIKKYKRIFLPEHPFSQADGRIPEHRLVMEKYLGRYLKQEEVVHHINGDTKDNTVGNLMLFKNHSEHRRYEIGLSKEVN